MGFTKERDSKGYFCWHKVLTPLTPTDTSLLKVSVPSSDAKSRVSDDGLTPTDTFSETFNQNSEAAVKQSKETDVIDPGSLVSEVSVGVNNHAKSRGLPTDTSTDTPTDTLAEKEGAIAFQSTQQSKSLAPDNDKWLTEECLQDMAAHLENCPDSETLADLRQCWPSHALNAACKRLKPQTRQRIRAWVLEQNTHLHSADVSPDQVQQPPASAEFKMGDRVALADPYTVAYSYHGTIEEVAGNEISVRWAERLGLPSEREMYHASELRRLEADEPPF